MNIQEKALGLIEEIDAEVHFEQPEKFGLDKRCGRIGLVDEGIIAEDPPAFEYWGGRVGDGYPTRIGIYALYFEGFEAIEEIIQYYQEHHNV